MYHKELNRTSECKFTLHKIMKSGITDVRTPQSIEEESASFFHVDANLEIICLSDETFGITGEYFKINNFSTYSKDYNTQPIRKPTGVALYFKTVLLLESSRIFQARSNGSRGSIITLKRLYFVRVKCIVEHVRIPAVHVIFMGLVTRAAVAGKCFSTPWHGKRLLTPLGLQKHFRCGLTTHTSPDPAHAPRFSKTISFTRTRRIIKPQPI